MTTNTDFPTCQKLQVFPIKAQFGDTLRIIRIVEYGTNGSFDRLYKECENYASKGCIISYVDSEEDLITISSDEDLFFAINEATNSNVMFQILVSPAKTEPKSACKAIAESFTSFIENVTKDSEVHINRFQTMFNKICEDIKSKEDIQEHILRADKTFKCAAESIKNIPKTFEHHVASFKDKLEPLMQKWGWIDPKTDADLRKEEANAFSAPKEETPISEDSTGNVKPDIQLPEKNNWTFVDQ